MNKHSIICVITVIGSFYSFCYGYVYQLSVMKKMIDSEQKRYQWVIGIGDYHDKSHPANSIQRAYLESLLKKCRLLKSKLIVEDLGSVNNDGKGMCCRYAITTQGGILGKLADMARMSALDVDNVEYRYCRVATIGPLLSNPRANPTGFASSTAISMDFLYNEIFGEIEKIKKYNDGTFLNALHKKTAQEVGSSLSFFTHCLKENQSVADYCKKLRSKDYIKHLERLCVFDSAIIDMKIIHSIISSPDKSVIIVTAGGSHIEKIGKMLTTMGYQKIVTPSPALSFQYHSLESALNSFNGKNSTKDHPIAVDLSILDKFIP